MIPTVLAGLHPRDPRPDVEVAPLDVEGGDHAEIKHQPERGDASGIQPINSRAVRDLNPLTEHALGIADFMVAQELSCRGRGILRLIHPEHIRRTANRTALAWPVRVPWRGREIDHLLLPDRLYGLRGQGKGSARADGQELDERPRIVVGVSFFRLCGRRVAKLILCEPCKSGRK